ncbi:MAG: sigma 54-interacting transcriptional regulator [Myxococcota bacterium]
MSEEGTANDERTVRDEAIGHPVRDVYVEVLSGDASVCSAQSADEPIAIGSAEGNGIQLRDRTVSRYHVEVRRGADGIEVRDLGSTNGTHVGDVLLRGSVATVRSGAVLRVGSSELRVTEGETRFVPAARERVRLGPLFGRSDVMLRLMDKVEQLAASDVPVLIVGESGTGKEVTARALHETGARADRPFVTVDCGAVAANLFESTLFVHEKGAFTGADRQRRGAFERAGDGVLFLDEIGELLPEQQVALLGVLERRRFVRVGGSQELPFRGRIVAATNRDLREAVNQGTFRLDLFYRLAIVTLALPPLRERSDDIPLLIERFLREEGSDKSAKDVFGARLGELIRHSWPGNARELRNVVAGALAIGEVPDLLPIAPAASPAGNLLALPYKKAKATLTHDFERRYVEQLLQKTGGNVAKAARDARMNRSYLIELLRKHGLK